MVKLELRDKVVSLKLTQEDYEVLRHFASIYRMSPSTVAYLIVRERLTELQDSPKKFIKELL